MNIKNILLTTLLLSASADSFPITQHYKDLAKHVALAVAIPTTIGGTMGASCEIMITTIYAFKMATQNVSEMQFAGAIGGCAGFGGLIGATIGSIKKKTNRATNTVTDYATYGAKIGAACGIAAIGVSATIIGSNAIPNGYIIPAITASTRYAAGIGFKIGSFIGTSLILENAYNQIYYPEKTN